MGFFFGIVEYSLLAHVVLYVTRRLPAHRRRRRRRARAGAGRGGRRQAGHAGWSATGCSAADGGRCWWRCACSSLVTCLVLAIGDGELGWVVYFAVVTLLGLAVDRLGRDLRDDGRRDRRPRGGRPGGRPDRGRRQRRRRLRPARLRRHRRRDRLVRPAPGWRWRSAPPSPSSASPSSTSPASTTRRRASSSTRRDTAHEMKKRARARRRITLKEARRREQGGDECMLGSRTT